MGEGIRKNEMTDLLSRTIADLLAAGLTPEELSLYTGMPAEEVAAAAAPENTPSVTVEAVIRVGKISYLLEDLRKRSATADRIGLILRAEVFEASIERFLGQSTPDDMQPLPAIT